MKGKLLVLLILLIHLVLLSNLRFTAWPEMILWPYLLDKGALPYQDIVVIYPPGLILAQSGLGKLFGVTLYNLQLYTWILILVSDLLVFWVAKRITKSEKIALLSLAFYVLWQPFFEGNAFWFDLILAPLGLAAFYFLIQKKFFRCGLFFGLSLIVKQTAFFIFLPILITFWHQDMLRKKPFLLFLLGTAIPMTFGLFYLLTSGIWREFYQWAISFGVFYLPRAEGQIQLPTLKNILALSVPFAAIFLFFITLLHYRNGVKTKSKVLLALFLWFLFASLGAYPRFEYFHFQPSLPFLAILSGWLTSYFNIAYKKKLNILFLIFLIGVTMGTIYLQQRFYRLNWQKPTRFFENDILETANWIKANTSKGEKIYILNSWDHLYALSDTLPAVSPLIHTLPWHLEYPGMQENYIQDLKEIKPRIVVFQPYSEKGLGSYRPLKIDRFLKENYTLSDIVAGRFWILRPKINQ